MLRKRKMEYDFVAEKVNTLPTREELEQYAFGLILFIQLSNYLLQDY